MSARSTKFRNFREVRKVSEVYVSSVMRSGAVKQSAARRTRTHRRTTSRSSRTWPCVRATPRSAGGVVCSLLQRRDSCGRKRAVPKVSLSAYARSRAHARVEGERWGERKMETPQLDRDGDEATRPSKRARGRVRGGDAGRGGKGEGSTGGSQYWRVLLHGRVLASLSLVEFDGFCSGCHHRRSGARPFCAAG